MSMFEDDNYQWRETYFVLFESNRRPTLEKMIELLEGGDRRLRLRDSQADDAGRFESITLIAPDDFAALDIAYLEGEEAVEQAATLATDMRGAEGATPEKLARLATSDARFDVMHFEQIVGGEEGDEMLDPSTLLTVLEELVRVTDGVGVDPQAGSLL